MEENQFWLTVWKYVITGFVALVTVLAGSCQMTNYQIRRAIDAGAAPIAARCAFDGENSRCVLQQAAEAESTRN